MVQIEKGVCHYGTNRKGVCRSGMCLFFSIKSLSFSDLTANTQHATQSDWEAFGRF